MNGSENPTSGLAMALACASYAHYVDFDVAPESAAIQVGFMIQIVLCPFFRCVKDDKVS